MTYTESNLPQLCMEVGLDCITCTSSTARELARACPSLPGKLVAQLFVQIHTYSECAPMHRHFAAAYEDAQTCKAAPEQATPAPKRMPMTAAGTARVAAAAA